MDFDEIFNDKFLLVNFVEEINRQLEYISDETIDDMRETLKFWTPEEDFESMDKLTILYRHAKLI